MPTRDDNADTQHEESARTIKYPGHADEVWAGRFLRYQNQRKKDLGGLVCLLSSSQKLEAFSGTLDNRLAMSV
jgi:hypothetical protein